MSYITLVSYAATQKLSCTLQHDVYQLFTFHISIISKTFSTTKRFLSVSPGLSSSCSFSFPTIHLSIQQMFIECLPCPCFTQKYLGIHFYSASDWSSPCPIIPLTKSVQASNSHRTTTTCLTLCQTLLSARWIEYLASWSIQPRRTFFPGF